MKSAFEPVDLHNLTLKNRLVRSATWEGLADENGRVTDRLISLLKGLATGGVGLIITGFAYIHPAGKVVPGQTGIYDDHLIPDLTRLTSAIHEAHGRLAIQIVHGGVQSRRKLTGQDSPPLGPSAVDLPLLKERPRELSVPEIQNLVEDFHLAAVRAKTAGFDAVQLHGAHGYLLSQFLSPYVNRRGDRYGGPLANRARIVYEVYEAVRAAVGSDFPVLIKMNCQDFVPGGLELEEAVKVAANLAEMGLDAVEVSGGLPWSGSLGAARPNIDAPEKEAYFRVPAAAFKEKMKIPVILVGGLRSPMVIEDVIGRKQADLVAISRPLIREPDLPRRWASGDLSPAGCISCGGCYASAIKGRGIMCSQLEASDK